MGRIWRQLPQLTKQRLTWAAGAGVALPYLAGEFAKRLDASASAGAALRHQLMIDILVAGSIFFALTMVFTVLLGCLIVAAMKGPRYLGDPFPSERQ